MADPGILLTGLPQLRAHGQRFVDGYIQFVGHHLGDGIHLGVGHIQHPPHIPDHAPGRQRTEGDDLHHPILAVLAHYIVDNLLAALKAEIHVNIRHGHPLRVQEALKEQAVAHGIQLGDSQSVGHQAAGGAAPARPHHNIVVSGVFDEIPHNQEIIHIPHGLNGPQLIVQPLPQLLCHRMIPLLQPFMAELIQILPGSIALGHIIFRQLGNAELDLHMAAVGDLLGVFQSLRGIGKQLLHLLGGFYIVLSALIAHPVFVLKFFPGLDAQQNIVGRRVPGIRIVNVICGRQPDAGLLAHAHQLGVHQPLLRDPVVLKLQEKIPLSENLLISEGRLFCLFIKVPHQIPLNLPGQTGRESDEPLMVLPQQLQIHSGFIVKSLHKTPGDDLHEVGIALVVLRQKHQVIIAVVIPACLPVKPGAGGYIDLAAQNGIDPRLPGRFIKINAAIHHPVIRNGRTVHPQFLYPGDVFFYLIGAVQQTVLRVYVQMRKIHSISFSVLIFLSRISISLLKRKCHRHFCRRHLFRNHSAILYSVFPSVMVMDSITG